MTPPTLVMAAHGTRSAAGLATTHALADLVRSLRPGLEVVVSFVDVAQPTFADVAAAVAGPMVVVPALLSAGYHVHVDIPRVLRGRPEVVVTPALGPDRVLSEILASRLAARSGSPAHGVALVATGSSDPAARTDVVAAAQDLASVLGRSVEAIFMTGPDASLDRALGPDVEVASYLLADGAFFDRLERTATAAGVPTVSRPIGVDPRLAALVLRRYDDGALTLAGNGVPGARSEPKVNRPHHL